VIRKEAKTKLASMQQAPVGGAEDLELAGEDLLAGGDGRDGGSCDACRHGGTVACGARSLVQKTRDLPPWVARSPELRRATLPSWLQAPNSTL
jgi:hypothetical protein